MLPPCVGSELEVSIELTGSDDVLFILGVKIFVSDNDLEIDGFSLGMLYEESGGRLAAFSKSSVEIRDLKLSLGKRFLKDDFPLDGPGDPQAFTSLELGVKRKFTFLGVGLGDGGIFISTESCKESSNVDEGISKKRLLSFC